ncbi:hypothetical protein SNE40_018176 [Patella caerulea]|uniref:Endonuclease/exonuclease/phosphatase domain-containing protein n=1 Tax=Patella caerulea TaxID=87958 RepID=A0AAN8JBB4_PATCE
MCKEFEIHMLNGRSNLDKPGNFTYMGPSGNSVVDYIIVSTNIFDAFCDFQVLNNDESDHFPITCNIKTNTKPAVRDGDVFTRHRFKWNNKISSTFESLFYTDDTHRELEIVAEQIQEYKIDEAVNGLERIFHKNLKCVIKGHGNTMVRQEQPGWWDDTCENMKAAKYKYLDVFRVTNRKEDLEEYKSAKRIFKNICNRKREIYKEEGDVNLNKSEIMEKTETF